MRKNTGVCVLQHAPVFYAARKMCIRDRDRLLGSPYDGQMLDIMKGQADETMMRQELPDELVIARKSGELDALDHDIAIVYTEKGNYIYIFFAWDAKDNNHARKILAETSKLVFDDFMSK